MVSPGLVMRGVFEILETRYSVTERPEYKINKAEKLIMISKRKNRVVSVSG